jgi:hypothetical protein
MGAAAVMYALAGGSAGALQAFELAVTSIAPGAFAMSKVYPLFVDGLAFRSGLIQPVPPVVGGLYRSGRVVAYPPLPQLDE